MSEPEAALKAVLEHPSDLAARLAYASILDARHDSLGEFIRLDCHLDGASRQDEEGLWLWDRRLALLEAHAKTWLEPLSGVAESTCFERGLVEWIELDLDTYLARGEEIFGRYPIRSLAISGAHARIDELLASRWITQIEYLSLPEPKRTNGQRRGAGTSPYGDLSDDDLAELAASNRLRNLRGLDLFFNKQLGPGCLDSILSSMWCGQLEFLGLGWTSVGDEGASRIASTDRLENLQRLNLSQAEISAAGARALADSATLARQGLTELDFSLNHEITPEANARLLRSPVLARVEEVRLDGDVAGELVDGLVNSDALRSMKWLRFGNSWKIDTASLRRLAQSPGLAGLEGLAFVLSGLTDEQLEVLATSPWLKELKSLSLSETEVTDDGVERLCRSPAWTGLEELGIDRNPLTERSVRAILSAVWFPQLMSLNLHASYTIGDAGARALASYTGPTRLRRLYLSMAGIGDIGALALAEADFATKLWMLWLRGNKGISPATSEVLKKRLGGRAYTTDADPLDYWRYKPFPHA